jgi:hypothetical protein
MVDSTLPDAPGRPRVTVILPLFGSHRAGQTLPTVARAWLNQDMPCEVVVAIAGDVPVALDEGEFADGRLRILRLPASMRAAGRLRNAAAAAARTPLLYLSDSDVLPLGPRFLRHALELLQDGGRVMVQPWLYRLMPGPDWQGVMSWTLPPGKVCFVTSTVDGVLTPLPGERFVRADKGLVRLPRGMERESDPWEQRVLSNYHWGSVLIERQMFHEVGGYCGEYSEWGSEDDDLLVKLRSRWPLVEAWRLGTVPAGLHFEHPRPYGGADLAPNMDILNRRTAMGPEAMIRADVEAAARTRG